MMIKLNAVQTRSKSWRYDATMNGGMDMNNGSDAIAEKEEAPIFPMSKQTLFFFARTARSKLPSGSGTHHCCMRHRSSGTRD